MWNRLKAEGEPHESPRAHIRNSPSSDQRLLFIFVAIGLSGSLTNFCRSKYHTRQFGLAHLQRGSQLPERVEGRVALIAFYVSNEVWPHSCELS